MYISFVPTAKSLKMPLDEMKQRINDTKGYKEVEGI